VENGSSLGTKLTQPRSDQTRTLPGSEELKMAQYVPPHRRALIIEDEIVIASASKKPCPQWALIIAI
jgi:hypothetical protein